VSCGGLGVTGFEPSGTFVFNFDLIKYITNVVGATRNSLVETQSI